MGYYPWQHCKLQEHCAFFTGVDRPCLDQSGTTSSPSAPPCHHQHWQKPILSIHNPASQVGIIRVYAASVQGVPEDQFRWVRYFRTKRPQTRIGTFLCGKTFTVKAEFAMHIAHCTLHNAHCTLLRSRRILPAAFIFASQSTNYKPCHSFILMWACSNILFELLIVTLPTL